MNNKTKPLRGRHSGILSKQDKENILSLFYRTELRQDEEVINNSDRQIANELGLKYNNVASFLVDHSNIKLDELKNRVNSK